MLAFVMLCIYLLAMMRGLWWHCMCEEGLHDPAVYGQVSQDDTEGFCPPCTDQGKHLNKC